MDPLYMMYGDVINHIKNKVESECDSFGAKLKYFRLDSVRQDGEKDYYFNFSLEISIEGVKKDMVESLKPCVKAAFVDLYDFNIYYHQGDINIEYTGSPKSGGFFSNLFGW